MGPRLSRFTRLSAMRTDGPSSGARLRSGPPNPGDQRASSSSGASRRMRSARASHLRRQPRDNECVVFDANARTSFSPAEANGSRFAFLNRSATRYFGEVRRLLDEWLSHVPSPGPARRSTFAPTSLARRSTRTSWSTSRIARSISRPFESALRHPISVSRSALPRSRRCLTPFLRTSSRCTSAGTSSDRPGLARGS